MNPNPHKPRKQDIQDSLELLQSVGEYKTTPLLAES